MRSSDGRSRGLLASCGAVRALGHPRPEDLLADVLDLDRAGLVRQVGQRRLHRDEPVHQVRLVVLEADVQHVGLAARRDVARHLEGHRRLAGALGAADEQQLARAQAGADRLVERREAERDRLVLGQVAGRDALVEVDEDVERGARRHAAVVGVEPPGRAAGAPATVVGRFRCSRGRFLPGGRRFGADAARAKGSTADRPDHPPDSLVRQAAMLFGARRSRRRWRRSPGWRPRSCRGPSTRWGVRVLVGWAKPSSTTGSPRMRSKCRDRDRAALAGVDRGRAERRLERAGPRPGVADGRSASGGSPAPSFWTVDGHAGRRDLQDEVAQPLEDHVAGPGRRPAGS